MNLSNKTDLELEEMRKYILEQLNEFNMMDNEIIHEQGRRYGKKLANDLQNKIIKFVNS